MIRLLLLTLLALFSAQAEMFQTVPLEKAQLLQQGEAKLYCPSCGMHLGKFYKTSHALEHEGHTHQYCSIHCLIEANPYRELKSAKVVDVTSLKFINVADAYYVIGSEKPGTMTMNSKYAFAQKADAEAFIKEHGGTLGRFDDALKATYADFATDTAEIDFKRKMMAQKGAKMYAALCDAKAALPEFHSIAQAKSYITEHKLCGMIDDQKAQAISIYLAAPKGAHQALDVPKEAKCPVCGMFVSKYPKWAAAITTDAGKTLYFDGVKDMMKFYFDPKAYHHELIQTQMSRLHVTEYYDIKAIDAKSAWYVIGSNVYGPMGKEPVAFESEERAKTFMKDHFGTAIVRFDALTPQLIAELDR
ncbi:MAG: nitrous oxide reductase accessory protein NosL [Campylobacterales bacterium]|nr:nitrous oxide reductase accessory protein NosL [Campylobacterales bacterium]